MRGMHAVAAALGCDNCTDGSGRAADISGGVQFDLSTVGCPTPRKPLTCRPKEDRFFSLDFNGKLGRAILESQLREEAAVAASADATSADSSGESGHSSSGNSHGSSTASHNGVSGPQNGKGGAGSVGRGGTEVDGVSGGRILIGHSLGAACAAAEAIARPEVRTLASCKSTSTCGCSLPLGHRVPFQIHARELLGEEVLSTDLEQTGLQDSRCNRSMATLSAL